MDRIDKIIDHIKSESIAECGEIARNAAEECERIREEYSRTEQAEYWKSINIGSKETEQRLSKLSSLADEEANKLISATRQEMLDEAFALAAKKLLELPNSSYQKLLDGLGLESGHSAEDVVARYKDVLSRQVLSALFD